MDNRLQKILQLTSEKPSNILDHMLKYDIIDESLYETFKKFYQNYHSSSLDIESLENIKRLYNYCAICETYKIKSISNVSTNKCIIDPLGNPISNINNIQLEVSDVNDELLKLLNKNPNYLYQLSPRKFEEVVAEILARKGYDVKLTSATRDGGKDIYVAQKTDLGSFLYVVECKKYSPPKKVGVSVLRDLYGVISKENLTAGIIATTSYFAKPAQEFQQDIKSKMTLIDFDSIKQWLCEVV